MKKGIYKITNLINDQSYIGCSNNIEKRWKNHILKSKNNQDKEYEKALYRAFRKYGINQFNFEILEEIDDEDQRFEREKY